MNFDAELPFHSIFFVIHLEWDPGANKAKTSLFILFFLFFAIRVKNAPNDLVIEVKQFCNKFKQSFD